MELQYPHIQTPDLQSTHASSHQHNRNMPLSSNAFLSITANHAQSPALFKLPELSPFRDQASNEFDTRQAADRPANSFEPALRTPANFSISPQAFKDAVTPFGDNYQLADDWIVSGSYVSPVIRAQYIKKQPSTLLSASPIASFIDRLQTHSLSSPPDPLILPRHTKHSSLSLLPLLSPYKPDCRSSKKENIIHKPKLSSLTYASSSISRRPIQPQARLLKAPLTPHRSSYTPLPISPLTPLTPSPPTPPSPGSCVMGTLSLPDPAGRKRRLSMSESPTIRVKRTRYELREAGPLNGSTSDSQPSPSIQSTFSTRLLPAHILVNTEFPLFYRRFPSSSYFCPIGSSSPCTVFGMPHPGGAYNPPRDIFDLYTPRFVKGRGVDKMGLCPICIEQSERGGEGKKVWLAMKFSAFK